MNFVPTYNIRSSEKDSEKNMVLCKKGDDITPFDGTYLLRTSVGTVPVPNMKTITGIALRTCWTLALR